MKRSSIRPAGNDVVEGGLEQDVLSFDGSAGQEIFDVFASGARTRLTRRLASIAMAPNDVERIDVFAGVDVDSITVRTPASPRGGGRRRSRRLHGPPLAHGEAAAG